MVYLLVRVQSEWRVGQPMAAPIEGFVGCILVAHPHEFVLLKRLGEPVHRTMSNGGVSGVDNLVAEVFDQSSSVA